ncbi:MAG: hypothetical protein ACREXT_03775 [Gammaproteobacteria bacterium]
MSIRSFARLAGILCLTANAPLALSADVSGNYAVWGIGQASCNQFVTAYDADSTAPASLAHYKDYLSGYLTAYNTVTEGVFQATGRASLDENLKHLRAYCAMHRMDSFERAIQALVVQSGSPKRAEAGNGVRWGRPPAPEEAP